jgi:hypothetical protein
MSSPSLTARGVAARAVTARAAAARAVAVRVLPVRAVAARTLAGRVLGPARRRLRAASPQGGALTLEWIVIAGILVAAATVAATWFTGVIHGFESKIP